jgi:hypothetical protein
VLRFPKRRERLDLLHALAQRLYAARLEGPELALDREDRQKAVRGDRFAHPMMRATHQLRRRQVARPGGGHLEALGGSALRPGPRDRQRGDDESRPTARSVPVSSHGAGGYHFGHSSKDYRLPLF